MDYSGKDYGAKTAQDLADLMDSKVIVYEGAVTALGTSALFNGKKFEIGQGSFWFYENKKKRTYLPKCKCKKPSN